MNTDNLIVISALTLVFSLIGALAFFKPEKKAQAFWHLIFMGIYSSVFLTLYIYHSEGGSALVYWFYWLVLVVIQILILTVQLLTSSK